MAAILDFSEKVPPLIGMVLSKGQYKWKVASTSPAIFLSMVQTNVFKSQYGSDVVWDCLLEPINHTDMLCEGDILEMESSKNES